MFRVCRHKAKHAWKRDCCEFDQHRFQELHHDEPGLVVTWLTSPSGCGCPRRGRVCAGWLGVSMNLWLSLRQLSLGLSLEIVPFWKTKYPYLPFMVGKNLGKLCMGSHEAPDGSQDVAAHVLVA